MKNTKVFNKEITEVDPFEFINNIRKTYGIDNPKSNYSEKGIYIFVIIKLLRRLNQAFIGLKREKKTSLA